MMSLIVLIDEATSNGLITTVFAPIASATPSMVRPVCLGPLEFKVLELGLACIPVIAVVRLSRTITM